MFKGKARNLAFPLLQIQLFGDAVAGHTFE
jgi:hypothetical protein